MARWQRLWLVMALVYMTPLGILIAAHPPYQHLGNLAVVLAPPAFGYVLAWLICR